MKTPNMNEKKFRNYVAYFPKTGRVKIGITGNFKKRCSYYKQEAARHDLGYVAFSGGAPQEKHVAMIVETEICRALKSVAIKNHREWFEGDAETFEAFVSMTARIQKQISAALNGEVSE